MKIILGSNSPRRRELLAGIGVEFTSININADESYPSELAAEQIPSYISKAKALAYSSTLLPDELLITSDTLVWLDGKVFGKPHGKEDAQAMLRQLSGRTHQVYTAVSFAEDKNGKREIYTLTDKTDVTFRALTDEEIAYYVEKYRPLDKAGAYGIQEYIGYIGVTGLNGSYFNVMGFPTEKVYEELFKRGLIAHQPV